MISQQQSTTYDWSLVIKLPDFNLIQEIRVHGTLHIGGCILKLINTIVLSSQQQHIDWSDYALWWPSKKLWLLKTKFTLDQYGVQANEQLIFTPIHKNICLELPDLQRIELKLNFSINLLQLVQNICKNLSIKHYEELSLLKNNTTNRGDEQLNKNNKLNDDNKLLDKISFDQGDPQVLAMSPIVSNIQEKLKSFPKYKDLFDKCRSNNYWLDSSKSLMEQDINENDMVKLRFKYFSFFDLNIKYDLIRINQLYEQAKWSILSEEYDCTEEELITFAAIQLQIQIQTKQAFNSTLNNKRSSNTSSTSSQIKTIETETNSNIYEIGEIINDDGNNNNDDDDDVDAALMKLEISLQNNSNLITINKQQQQQQQKSSSIIDLSAELCEELFLMKHKYTFKKFKTFYFVLRDTYLSYFKTKSDYIDLKSKPIEKYCLKNCEIIPELNVLANKYGIYLKIFQSNEITDIYLRCLNDDSYAKWLAAIKLASKNKTINDVDAYNFEIDSVKNLIDMQKNKKQSSTSSSKENTNGSQILDDFQVQNFVPQFLCKKFKTKQLTDRIIETHSNLSDLNLLDAKLRYIKTWQALPDYGITYFCVRFKGSKYKEELLGVSATRLLRYNFDCKLIKQWRLNLIKTWYVNWDIKQFDIEFEDEKLTFQCITNINPKILNEYIGAYIFLSLRTDNTNDQNLDQELFFKLTDKH